MTGSRITFYLSICPRRPESGRSVRRESSGDGLQNRSIGRFPSPPSSWPGRELRKYHCPRCLSSPPPAAIRIPLHGRFSLVIVSHGAPAAWLSASVTYLTTGYSVFIKTVLTGREKKFPHYTTDIFSPFGTLRAKKLFGFFAYRLHRTDHGRVFYPLLPRVFPDALAAHHTVFVYRQLVRS